MTDKEKLDNATEPLLAALNGLFEQVGERNQELRELNQSLEAKVADRTRSLAQANERLEQLAMTDALTGLPNRRLMGDRLHHAMVGGKRSRRHGALMFMDLDNFKSLNDNHGHEAGDLLLKEVAQRLTGSVRESDSVARLGGDEFVVLLQELDSDLSRSQAQAALVAEKRSAIARASPTGWCVSKMVRLIPWSSITAAHVSA